MESLGKWYRFHIEDYEAVEQRLAACRNVMLHGRSEAAAAMLRRSTTYAVLSIQTQLDRHERAFTAYAAGDTSLETAAGMTNYGNQKAQWLHESLATFDFEEAVRLLREKSPFEALRYIESNFKGLSWVKGAFSLAMCGIWELACPDTHTKNAVGYEGRVRSLDDFCEALDMIDDSLSGPDKLFIKQWACFDAERGEHARHMAFFTEALPALTR